MTIHIDQQFYDPVIDGYNIHWVRNAYKKAQEFPEQYLLVHFNIKNFRYYRSLYGKEESNKILKLIYQTISNFLEDGEYIGHDFYDNFVILFKSDDITTFCDKRMLKLIDCCYRINDPRIHRNNFGSYGIFPLSHHECDFEEAYYLANLARKQTTGLTNRSHNYEVFDDSYLQNYVNRCNLETNTAYAFFDYEFIPFLQPKVDPKTNRIIGAESLIRWKDKDGNFIPVSEFLPILIENTYIVVVDIDIFEAVCKMIDERIKANLPVVPISFNISKPEFYDDKLVQNYLNVFNQFSIPSDLIEFEFMESISLDDSDRLSEMVTRFKEAGFSCSLDDFGNGFSSFNVLLNADFDTIKLDRAFFTKPLTEAHKVIINTIVNLVKKLNMQIVAEGVETKDYVDLLTEYECEAIQGYYYHKPMPMTDFYKLLDD